MENKILAVVKSQYVRDDVKNFNVGDYISIQLIFQEKNKKKIQNFDGLCISKKGTSNTKTFTLRKNLFGVNVERTFFLNSPSISKIDIINSYKVRRAKLYFLRKHKGKNIPLVKKTQYLSKK
ncbi:50S ribosomal protein L19 [symbiont of Argiope bruennichi]|uniref:50S ribosomal protein L19 n=1 Tax=symbiont of Argiope bruennichi TaxID=2810479 RepID=UPI003DA38192